jgi:hypothetical protein
MVLKRTQENENDNESRKENIRNLSAYPSWRISCEYSMVGGGGADGTDSHVGGGGREPGPAKGDLDSLPILIVFVGPP